MAIIEPSISNSDAAFSNLLHDASRFEKARQILIVGRD
jgi:hypothetical protein